MSSTTFDVRENTIAAHTGLNRDELRARRAHYLVQGVHWDYVNKRTLYSATGAAILEATSRLPCPAKNGAQQDCAPRRSILALLLEKNPPRLQFKGELIVWRAAIKNPRLLSAYLPGADPHDPLALCTVLVADNRNFMPGMKLTSLNPLGDNRYELKGPCPRWRGRW